MKNVLKIIWPLCLPLVCAGMIQTFFFKRFFKVDQVENFFHDYRNTFHQDHLLHLWKSQIGKLATTNGYDNDEERLVVAVLLARWHSE